MAIETVITFAMGIALAIGTISVFNSYRAQAMDTTTEKEAEIIQSEIENSIFHLERASSGTMEVDLPSDIGGSDYTVSLYEGVQIGLNYRTIESNFTGLNQDYSFRGTVDGGTVKIYKNQDEFVLRSG